MAKNVIMIDDPNNVNVWHTGGSDDRINQINGAPPYEDMHVFAELTATNKARTILVSGGDGTKFYEGEDDMSDTLRVNFMGNDQNLQAEDRNNPNYLNFTTNYYDGSTGENINFESFGMTSINVVINSSFIPQVNIQFTDIRGLSFFNEKTSPYRILFDFPPPIFNLTIKGYYGKTLSYRLHLVKYTSEFKSENGNFIIDAQFVAMTYAPLTDILFRYVINFPLINEKSRVGNPDTAERPVNTNDLIIKLRNLYSAVSDLLKTDKDAIEYDKNIVKLEKNTELIGLLHNYSNELTDEYGKPFLLKRSLLDSGYFASEYELSQTTYNDYDAVIIEQSSEYDPSKMQDKLIIAYAVTPNDNGENEGTLATITGKLEDALLVYKNSLLKAAGRVGTTAQYSEDLISNPDTFNNNYNATSLKTNPNIKTKYAFIDITKFYLRIYKDRNDIQNELTELTEILGETINNMVLQNLGMNPTIYNIFKVILDDVDDFFDILRTTSYKAENEHHVLYKDLIINDPRYKDIKVSDTNSEDKIYAFPLVIKSEPVCGGFTEERVAPLAISEKLPKSAPFPELVLVDDFINTFFTQKNTEYLLNMKDEQDDEGAHIWIPVSPVDSVLAPKQIESPYIGIDNTDGGSVFQPINDKGDVRLTQVLGIVMKRFYILSQAVIPDSFYSTTDVGLRDAYIKLYSASEANNLAISITEEKFGDNIQAIARAWGNEPNQTSFYTYLENNLNDTYYDFTEEERKFFPMSGNNPAIGINVYVDKNNPNYEGLQINDDSIDVRRETEASDNPIDLFQNGLKTTWKTRLFNNITPEFFFSFTKENVLYLQDIKISGKGKRKDVEQVNGLQIDTRFLAARNTITTSPGKIKLLYEDYTEPKNQVIDRLLVDGNFGFRAGTATDASKLKGFENVIDTWSKELGDHDTQISGSTIYSNSKLAALIYMSNFGWTQGMFNQYYRDLNNLIFDNPSAIDVPVYLPLYMGALVDAERNNWLDDIKDYFTGTTDGGENLQSSGLYVFADYRDVNTLLSEMDKDVLQDYFINFYDDYFDTVYDYMKDLFEEVQNIVPDDLNDRRTKNQKEKAYKSLLKDEYFETTVGAFLKRTTIINFSQNTFNPKTDDEIGYKSLKTLNETEGIKTINDAYFKTFFSALAKAVIKKQKADEDERNAESKLKGDDDIRTQTYYSFKNINDKWLSSPVRQNPEGYPFNAVGKDLIDQFAFVDRAMNPIGNTIINPEILIDLYDDHNVSVFGVLTQLLSSNGFEFFPLQNFMTHSRQSWEDSFKITTETEADYSPSFVCMYIGGTSSYPTGVRNGFIDDGIVDLSTTNAPDFSTTGGPDCTNEEDDNQLEKNTNFEKNYRNVRAFRVKFGEQNQSMFKDIKIDSKEYPETNESIQILSRISGDNKLQAPIPKGQNLYNMYENRAYKATVSGLGNAMIQPTQYFQLDNVPMFNGAYLILNVEHNLVPNKMTTKFSGTKILQFPIPRVRDSAALFGFGGGESRRTKVSDLSAADAITGLQATSMSDERLDELDSVYGIDVSYVQRGMDWNKTGNNDTTVDFAFIKASQGWDGAYKSFYDGHTKYHVDGATDNNIKFTYYHFAMPFYGSNDEMITNATEQAEYFLSSLSSRNLPEPDFPLALDFENYKEEIFWGTNKEKNDLWINTFADVVKEGGYDTMLYINKNLLSQTSGNFPDIPLWYARPIQSKTESSEYDSSTPTAPGTWKDWSIWQFSFEGRVDGYNGVTDINAMRKSFFRKNFNT